MESFVTLMFEQLLKKEWYFQGFNGTPALLYGPMYSMFGSMPDTLGFGYSACIEYFQNDVCYYLYAWDDLHFVLKNLLEKYHQDSNYISYLVEQNEIICKQVESELRTIDTKQIRDYTTEELFVFWRKINKLYEKIGSVSHIIEGFVLPTEPRIRELVDKNMPGQSVEMVPFLTAPSSHSFMTTEHYELCCIARECVKMGDNFATAQEVLKDEIIAKKLEAHQEKYFWKLNSYTSAKVVSVEDFANELVGIIKKGVDVEKIISDYQALPARVEARDAAIESIEDTELRILLHIGDSMFKIHDRRKECITFTLHYVDSFLKEMSNRFNTPLEELRYIRVSELEQLPGIAPELKERRKQSVYIYSAQNEVVLTGSGAAEFYAKLHTDDAATHITELKGNCASRGKVTGVVKVCRGEKEIYAFQEGQILVACMTQPEFVPAMKKAIAVITDEGGLTSHAAIVSRELGVPCVIGTKNATKVLKDGDRVEVDADKGLIRILK